jgi:hypothetical protein
MVRWPEHPIDSRFVCQPIGIYQWLLIDGLSFTGNLRLGNLPVRVVRLRP